MQPSKSENKLQNESKKKVSRPKQRKGEGTVKSHQIGFLVTPDEYEKIRENSRKYHNGNVSDWLRLRAIEPCLDISVDMDDNS